MKRLLVALTVVGLLAGLAAAPVAAGSNPAKTTICHMSDEYPYAQTITVSNNALTAHRAHGDYIGPCVTTPTATVQVVKNTAPQDNSLWNFVVTNGNDTTYHAYTDQLTPFNSGVLTIPNPTYIEIDEWAGTGGDIAGYSASVVCTDNGGSVTPTASTYYSSPTRFYVYFPIQAGHAYVCTFTNTRERAYGTVNWTAYNLARTTAFDVTGNPAGGTFHYSDTNGDYYDVVVSCSSFSGNTAYFGGIVSAASQSAWNGQYLLAKVLDNSPDQVWGSFVVSNPCSTIGTVNPSDGPFNVTSGDLTVVSAP